MQSSEILLLYICLKKLNEEVSPMDEYINKQELLKEIDDLKKSPWYNDSYGFGLQQARHDGVNVVVDLCIKQAPTADVVEVVHGHNKTSMHPVDEFWCSVCGFCCADYTETKYDEDGDYLYSCECEFDYCPKCGAKMDGERRCEE